VSQRESDVGKTALAGVTAFADEDGGRRRRASRAGCKTVAYGFSARSCAAGAPDVSFATLWSSFSDE